MFDPYVVFHADSFPMHERGDVKFLGLIDKNQNFLLASLVSPKTKLANPHIFNPQLVASGILRW